ncbi:GIY-YIG nuclease family protein [Paraburkholderia sp. MM5477-R1]|uniref:GIY-YIG nuclease family protein n=1 Tax=Paraburkholderia sp. MM5477-R1 TaxID=2991062 RepID=UPI003D254480
MAVSDSFRRKAVAMGAACVLILNVQPCFSGDSWQSGDYDPRESQLGVDTSPSCRGVYIITVGGTPFYVGKSREIRKRLREHFTGAGSTAVASILNQGQPIKWNALCTDSDEQVEAQLMERLHTTSLGNLRIERDPGD